MNTRIIIQFLICVGALCTTVFSAASAANDAPADHPLVILGQDNEPATENLAERVVNGERVTDFLSFVDDLLILETPLTISFEADEGPLYDPQINEILMPDSFAEEIAERLGEAGQHSGQVADQSANLQTVVEDVYLHTLLHEIAHALVSMYDLPVLGKEEDAADNLGTVVLVEYLEGGGDIALSASDMFGAESDDIEVFEESDFWGEHSLDVQRYYAVLCHVYGSDPQTYSDLLSESDTVDDEFLDEAGLLGAERAEACVDEYAAIADNWLRVLEPWLSR